MMGKNMKLVGNVFLSSDPHLGHGNIIKYCRRTDFVNAEEKLLIDSAYSAKTEEEKYEIFKSFKISRESIKRMDDAIIHNYNAKIKEKDTLLLLGDFAFVKTRQEAEAYRKRINCKNIIFIWGNHDNRNILTGVFENHYDQKLVSLPSGDKVFLNHYAMVTWDQSHRGSYHAFGHSHGNFNQYKDKNMRDIKSLDVGVDCHNYQPLSFNEFKHIVDIKTSVKQGAIDKILSAIHFMGRLK